MQSKTYQSYKKKAAGALKTASKRAIHKKSQATVDLIGSKIANRITKVSKTLQQNNSEKNTNENGKELPKERYVSLEERQKIIDDLRLLQQYNNGISKNNKFAKQYTKSTKDLDVEMLMYNLIGYSNDYVRKFMVILQR